MENIRNFLIKKDLQSSMQLSIFLIILLILFLIGLCFWNKVSFVLIWIPTLPFIRILKRKSFFKNAEFCYGKIVDVTLSNNDDVYMYTKIEFIDYISKKTHKTIVDQHWGDFREEDKDKMNEFYEEGKKRIGKNAPLFYKKENPNKNKVFINDLED